MVKNILITGGAGYIGSHIVVELLKLGFNVTIVDNLTNSKILDINKIKKISKKNFFFYCVDIRNTRKIIKILKERNIEFVFHLAALKAVNESVLFPDKYYNNNIFGHLSLTKAMMSTNVTKLIFSSSAVIYGNTKSLPIKEDQPKRPLSPYGITKLFCEDHLDYVTSMNKEWKVASLRYFNPVGSHPSGVIGDKPDKPNNIMPIINSVAFKKKKKFEVFGTNYITKDGSAVRDYIHIMDVVNAHILCLKKINKIKGHEKFNIGTGKGVSVLKLLKTYQKVNKIIIKNRISQRRKGDIPISYADVRKIKKRFSWKSKFKLDEMCKSSYNFALKNFID